MMPPDPPYKIITTAEDATFNGDGTVTHQIRVKFMVGTHGPFSERFDKATFSQQMVDAKLRPFAGQIWSLMPTAQ